MSLRDRYQLIITATLLATISGHWLMTSLGGIHTGGPLLVVAVILALFLPRCPGCERSAFMASPTTLIGIAPKRCVHCGEDFTVREALDT